MARKVLKPRRDAAGNRIVYCRFCGRTLAGKRSSARGFGEACRLKHRQLLESEALERFGNVPIFGDPLLKPKRKRRA